MPAVVNRELTKFGAWEESKALFAVGDSRTVTMYRLETFHHLTDEHGRQVGGRATVSQHVAREPDGRGGCVHTITDRWVVNICATRNGCTYGAATRRRVFDSLEEAQKAAINDLEQQLKRYLKKYGPGRA